MLEVEFKASLEGIPPAQIEDRWRSLGFIPATQQREEDTYYGAPGRDFHRSDEALRLRRRTCLPDGPVENLLTYKGPKLDTVSRTRREYEVAVSDGETAARLLEALGYTPDHTVRKNRRELKKDGVTLCLDEVEGLGRFIELEKLVEDGGDRDAARQELLELLEMLGVPRKNLTRFSYLEQLIRKEERAE